MQEIIYIDIMSEKVYKRFFSLALVLFLYVSAYAVPASSNLFTRTQSDGSVITLRLMGDEHLNCLMTSDKFVVEKNAQGCYEYVISNGETKTLSGVVAHNPAERSQAELQFVSALPLADEVMSMRSKAKSAHAETMEKSIAASFPLTGEVRSLVILVNYADVKFSVSNPQVAYTNLLNQTGYSENNGTGSANDYFLASSNGVFDPTFDVVGPYDLPNNMEYYGANSGSSNGVRASQMIIDACALANADGVDFSNYDVNNDGVVDNIFVYYAGYNEAEGGPENSVWPHRSTVNSTASYNGKRIYDYACTSELRSYSGTNMCGIGTFCHEFGHVLGLPDFYNTDDSYAYTVGTWDIMCSGSYNNSGRTPPVYTAFERFSLNWLVPEQLTNASNYVLEPLETANTAYIIAASVHNLSSTSPSPNEYFMIENRQRVGWDAVSGALPGVGLLITHITYSSANWNANRPNNNPNQLGYDIVEAYSQNPTSSSATDTYPGTANITTFIPSLNNGTTLSEMALTNIFQNSNLTVSFLFNGGNGGSGFSFFPTQLPTLTSTYDSEVVSYDNAELIVSGTGLDPADAVEISINNTNFEFSADSMKTWTRSFTDVAKTDSTYKKVLYVRHTPRRQSCDQLAGILKVTTATQSVINQINLSGTAPRPIYITVPQVDSATNVSPYSFLASWHAQEDAELYYLTAYSLQDAASSIIQGFEDFNDADAVTEAGWYMNFSTTTTSSSADGARALSFTATGDTLQTEKYVYPITGVSFWVNANYITSSTGGTVGGLLTLEAYNGNEWQLVDGGEVNILRTTSNVTKSFTFPLDSNFVQFRVVYEHLGGSGGVLLDAFTAEMNKTVVYQCKGRDKYVFAPDTVMYFSGLTPQTTYYYQVQAAEEKSCRGEYLTDLSERMQAITLPGETSESKMLTILYEDGKPVVYVPIADSKRKLYVYTVQGYLVAEIDVESLINRVDLPALQPGNVYMVKYSEEGKMRRKDQWGKLIAL